MENDNKQQILIICRVKFSNGKTEYRFPTIANIEGMANSPNPGSAIEYLRRELKDVEDITILDIIYFKTQQDYDNHIKSYI